MMPTLPGVQPIPNSCPADLRTVLSQLRERALATKPQFTDEQVAALLKLLKTPKPTTPAAPTPTSYKTTFLDAPYKLYDGQGTNTWQSAKASDAGVPADAIAVIVEARWVLFGRVGDTTRYAWWRIDPAKGNGSDPSADTFIITSGTGGRDSNVDGSGGFTQGKFPLASDGTFSYLTNPPGYGWTSLLLRIIGYEAPVSTS